MGFADKFVWSLNSHDLRDDEFHHDLDALGAAALGDTRLVGEGAAARLEEISFGALLCRVKYADGTIHKDFEGNAANLAQLLRLWIEEVTKRGKARKWVTIRSEMDISAAHTLYRRVAEASLAHWIDGKCGECHGSGVTKDRTICKPCRGTGDAEITCSGGFERERIRDMLSELGEIAASHAWRANQRLRRNPDGA